jgi:hypothetical protein
MPTRISRFVLCLWVLSCALAGPVLASPQKPCKPEPVFQDGSFGTKDCNGVFTPTYKPSFTLPLPASEVVEPVPGQSSAGSRENAAKLAAEAEEYSQWNNSYVRKVFEWQFYSTVILFLVVVTLVSFGLYFAYIQFILSSHMVDETPQELKISAHEVVLKSSFLGVVILAFSLAFFFLYLRYVYPISPTELGPAAAVSDKTGH